MITKQEAIALIDAEIIILNNYGETKTVVLLTDVYDVLNKIFDESPIKDSCNNNSNCEIKIG